MGKTGWIVGGVSLVAIVALTALKQATAPPPRPKPSPVASATSNRLPSGQYVTVENQIFAAREADLDAAVRMISQGDREAFTKMVQSGRVGVFKGGDRVFLEECLGTLCSKARVRPEGQTATVYVLREGIERQ